MRPEWRTSRLLVAALLLAGAAGGCGGDDAFPPVEEAAADPSMVPTDHGLPEALVAELLPSTVGIDGVACGRVASGSGFAVTERLVVTNAHVVLGVDEISVHTLDGRELAAVAVAFDPEADLAILDVPDADLVPLPMTENVPIGSTGMLVGWESRSVADPTPYRVQRRVTVRIEIVGGDTRVERPAWLLSADVEPGDSGAALIDRTGEVIGVAFATSTAGPGVGYAVRASAIDALLAAGLDPNLSVPPC